MGVPRHKLRQEMPPSEEMSFLWTQDYPSISLRPVGRKSEAWLCSHVMVQLLGHMLPRSVRRNATRFSGRNVKGLLGCSGGRGRALETAWPPCTGAQLPRWPLWPSCWRSPAERVTSTSGILKSNGRMLSPSDWTGCTQLSRACWDTSSALPHSLVPEAPT